MMWIIRIMILYKINLWQNFFGGLNSLSWVFKEDWLNMHIFCEYTNVVGQLEINQNQNKK